MAQTTILAAGTSAAVSSDVVVAPGSVVSIGIFAATPIPPDVVLYVKQDTPIAADNVIAKLTHTDRAISISSPGTYRVKRGDIAAGGISVGAYLEA